jgi:hypothetical protein
MKLGGLSDVAQILGAVGVIVSRIYLAGPSASACSQLQSSRRVL